MALRSLVQALHSLVPACESIMLRSSDFSIPGQHLMSLKDARCFRSPCRAFYYGFLAPKCAIHQSKAGFPGLNIQFRTLSNVHLCD